MGTKSCTGLADLRSNSSRTPASIISGERSLNSSVSPALMRSTSNSLQRVADALVSMVLPAPLSRVGSRATTSPLGGEGGQEVDVARYHFLCAQHGPCGSSKIKSQQPPHDRRCPVCGDTAEIWVGYTCPTEQ